MNARSDFLQDNSPGVTDRVQTTPLWLWAIPLVVMQLWASATATGQQSRPPVQSQIIFESGTSVGNIHLFAYAADRRIIPFGIEYDLRFKDWWRPLHIDYVAEIMPVIFLREPAEFAPDSKPLTTSRQTNYGLGLWPAGFRVYGSHKRRVHPYFIAKGGFLYFGQRPLSQESTKLNFSSQIGGGAEVALNPRLGLRLGFSDFHFSNGNISARNPGIDFMYFNAGLSCRLGRQPVQQ
jgi:hypothetical protein